MLGRIPRFAIPIAIVVLAAILSVAINHFVIAPAQADLAKQQSTLQDTKDRAGKLQAAVAQLADVTRQWKEAQEKVQRVMEARSIPLSFYMPIEAMIAVAYEYRHDLGPVLTKWLESTGCTITSTIALPAPPGSPPSASGGFFPEGTSLSVSVHGTLEQIRALYESLSKCPRILTISGLALRPESDGTMDASFALSVYLLVEAPASAAAAAPAAGGGGGMPGMGGGMPGMGGSMPGMGGGMPGMGGSMPGMSGPAGGAGGAAAPGAKAGKEETGGGEEGGGSGLSKIGKHGAEAGGEE